MARGQQTSIEITVNGTAHQVEATPETPLLYVLRNEMGLHAARFGCGLSICGTCTVLHEGQPIRSCVTPVGDVAGSRITTLEGLGSPDNLHPLQQAFLDEQAAQCGYCISGIIMTAAALLEHNPHPAETEIRDALSSSVCRCGTHTRILRAIQRATGTTV
jgi:nicotinate dehydrogenase subunit A